MPLLRYPLFFLLLLCYGGNATAQGFSVAGTVGYAGPRLYFTSPARKVRPFINALFGLNSFNSERINRDDVQNSMLGISVGAYANIRQFVVGLALETDGLVALKAGYAF